MEGRGRTEVQSYREFDAEENMLGTSAVSRSSAAARRSWPRGELDRVRPHPRGGLLTGREVLRVVVRRAAEHWGEAQLTRSLLLAGAREGVSP